jgi:hypothetical protein
MALDERKKTQLAAVGEYVKFHIGLYLGTPPALAVVAEGLGVNRCKFSVWGIVAMVVIFLMSGISAAWFMGSYVNTPWDEQDQHLSTLYAQAVSLPRRIVQHWLYWLGLLLGVAGIAAALGQHWVTGHCS